MASLNKVLLLGNLGSDPEIRTLSGGGKVASFRLATTEHWKKDGEKRERTEWHSVVVFNDGLVGIVEKYLRKGSKVYIEGQLQTRKWQDKSGNDRYTTEVVLQAYKGELKLLDGKPEGQRGGGTPQTKGGASCDDELNDAVPFATCDPALEARVS